jgi:hypothetical protein
MADYMVFNCFGSVMDKLCIYNRGFGEYLQLLKDFWTWFIFMYPFMAIPEGHGVRIYVNIITIKLLLPYINAESLQSIYVIRFWT